MNRLLSLRKEKKLSQLQVSKDLSITSATYSRYESGDRNPPNDMLIKLSDYFGVSSDYLLGIDDNPKSKAKTIWIPILGNVPAGLPITECEYNFGYVEIPEEMAKLGELFSLLVKGDSMEPEIRNGDVAIVLKQPDAESGDIVVARVNGDETTIKRLKKQDKGILLIPSNSSGQYSPIFFSSEEIIKLPVEIVGKILEIRRKY